MNHAESGRVGELVLLSQHSIAEEEILPLTFLDSPLIAGGKNWSWHTRMDELVFFPHQLQRSGNQVLDLIQTTQ